MSAVDAHQGAGTWTRSEGLGPGSASAVQVMDPSKVIFAEGRLASLRCTRQVLATGNGLSCGWSLLLMDAPPLPGTTGLAEGRDSDRVGCNQDPASFSFTVDGWSGSTLALLAGGPSRPLLRVKRPKRCRSGPAEPDSSIPVHFA
jgi:hypothetical protein